MVTESYVGRKSPEIMASLARAPIYKKQGWVMAEPAIAGEKVTTVLKTGAQGTVSVANEGDWIVTNPSGERYVISEKKFLDRYEATDKSGIYTAKGYCRAIPNPFGRPIEIMASWGSPQYGDEKCMFADTCDASGRVDGEPYLIDGDAFVQTYIQVASREINITFKSYITMMGAEIFLSKLGLRPSSPFDVRGREQPMSITVSVEVGTEKEWVNRLKEKPEVLEAEEVLDYYLEQEE